MRSRRVSVGEIPHSYIVTPLHSSLLTDRETMDVFMYITDGEGEGKLGKVVSITDTYNVKADGRIYKKEGWQLRDMKAHEKLVKEGRV